MIGGKIKPIPNTNMTSSIYACNVTVYVGIGDDLGARSSPTYRRVYASTGSVIRSLESRFRGQKKNTLTQQLSGPHLNSARLYSSIRNVGRLIEPGVTGARLNALDQPALVYKNTGLVSTEWVTFFYPI